MSTPQPYLSENDSCPCGAALDPGTRRCRKCRARSRWRHRQAHRRRPVSPRPGTSRRGR
jgi:hypothetical protein